MEREIGYYREILDRVEAVEVLDDFLFFVGEASLSLYRFCESSLSAATGGDIDECQSLITVALAALKKCEAYKNDLDKYAVDQLKEEFLNHRKCIEDGVVSRKENRKPQEIKEPEQKEKCSVSGSSGNNNIQQITFAATSFC